jgi:VWFA-related protein
MQDRLRVSIALALSLLAAGPAAIASPATPPAPQQEGFGETVDVQVVNVDVFVADKDGNPVSGLNRKDFEVREDGKRVEITNFEAVDRRATPAPGESPRAAAADPQSPVASPAGTAPADAMHLVVYIDNVNIRPAHRARVLQQLRDFLTRELQPDDRVMLATYDLDLQVRLPFTTDRAALRRALEDAERLSASGDEIVRARRAALQQILDSQERSQSTNRFEGEGEAGFRASGGFAGSRDVDPEKESNVENDPLCPLDIVLPARMFAETTRRQVLGDIAALKMMVGSLSGLPGRKALLHVSDGISVTPGEELNQALYELCGGGALTSGLSSGMRTTPIDSALGSVKSYRGRNALIDAQAYNTAPAWSALAAHANARRVTFYTLQASGLEAAAASAADADPGDRMLSLPTVASVEAQNRQNSLSVLALDTGGRPIFNTNDVRPDLARMRDDLDRYYSLGFKPRTTGDGRQHRIEVRVLRKGLQVRHPLSYRDRSPFERAADRTLAALFYGTEENPLEVAVEVGEIRPAEGRTFSVPVRLRIPLFKLFLQDDQTNLVGRIRLLVATQDAGGATSKVRQLEVPVRISRDKALIALGKQFQYELTLTMTAGEQRVAIAVQDAATSQASYLARNVRVGGSESAVRAQR